MTREEKAMLFVKVWQTSTSIGEVCGKLRLSKSAVYSRAKGFRRNGVPLKRLSGAQKYDWEKLKAYAKSLGK